MTSGRDVMPPELTFLRPLTHEPIELCFKDAVTHRPIRYTDCMECSVLRFLQLVLSDLQSLSPDGQPTRVDLALVRLRVVDADVREYFEEFPEILPPEAYKEASDDGPGFHARQEFARLVTHKEFFTYKRDTGGVYKNDVLLGDAAKRGEWQLELEPCVYNVFSALEHVLGVDFTECRSLARDDTPSSAAWQAAGEAHIADVSAAAKYFDFAMRSLSRPGLSLRGHIHPPRCPRPSPTNSTTRHEEGGGLFYVDLDLAVNGEPAWRWVLTRVYLTPCRQYEHLCGEEGVGGKRIFITSKHSQIRQCWREDASWSWLAESHTAESKE